MQDIAIYGAGGFGREVACMIKAINKETPVWNMIGFFDDGVPEGPCNRYGACLGGMEKLNSWPTPLNINFSIASPHILKKLTEKITNPLISFPNLIGPNVNIFDEESLTIGKGNLIFTGSRISCDVTIGDFNLLNGYVSLGHDAVVGSFNILGPVVRLSGNTTVGDCNFFGVQSIVLQGLKVGNNTRIGANSVIMRKTADNCSYIGNPAKKLVV